MYRVSQKKHSYKIFGLEIMLFTCSQSLWSCRLWLTPAAESWPQCLRACLRAGEEQVKSMISSQKFYKSVFSGTPCRKRSVILTQYIWRSFVSNIDTIRSLYHLTRSSCSDFSTALKGRHRFRSIRHLSSTHPPKPAVNQGSDTYDSLLQGQQKLDYKIQFNFITVCRATSV